MLGSHAVASYGDSSMNRVNSFVLRFIALLTVLCAIAVLVVVYDLTMLRTKPAIEMTVIIEKGTTFSEAAQQIGNAGIADTWALRLLERLHVRSGELAAGKFVFRPRMTAAEVYAELKSSALPVARWVTIPEGFTIRQIDARLRAGGFANARNFSVYALHQSIRIGGVKTRSLEGFLFPSTYFIANDADSPAIAAMMVAEFRRRLPLDAAALAAKQHVTVPQAVTVASLIEREAKRNEERPLMAGVYYHRLAIGMPLEVDATLEYGFAKHHTVITERDLRKDTPYNSYKHRGLPPTPIANPGLPSLLAALHPVHTNYLYYVYRGGGRHAFAASLKEHNQNVNRYLH
jgi:UPF0755 protein